MINAMKTIRFATIALVCALAFAACKKEQNAAPNAATSSFLCKVDGADYKVTGTLAYGFNFGDSFGIYGLTGSGNQETCFISLPAGTGKGTYTLNTTTSNMRGNFTDLAQKDYSTLWGQGTGTVTITEIDATHVKGSFSFTAYDGDKGVTKKTITEGAFNVAFR
jgi:hypothetical protein